MALDFYYLWLLLLATFVTHSWQQAMPASIIASEWLSVGLSTPTVSDIINFDP